MPPDLEGLLSGVISPEDSATLLAIRTDSEILSALNSFLGSKASGSDGFTPLFFQHYWELIKFDLIFNIQQFFLTSQLPLESNHTFLTLIPKTKSANSISLFRPISLCNTTYKIISKILASRIQPFLI